MRVQIWPIVLVAACAPAPREPAAIDAPVASALCYAPSTSGTATAGTSSIESCAIWNSIAKMTGAVTLSRDATMLTIAFATGVTFTGTVVDRAVDLTYSHLHTFTDGCLWRATEKLTGDLDPATCMMTLDYRYIESVEMSNGACASPCAGTGMFSLQVAPIL